MKNHIIKFHKEIVNCYQADEELRTKKNYFLAYLRLNQPHM